MRLLSSFISDITCVEDLQMSTVAEFVSFSSTDFEIYGTSCILGHKMVQQMVQDAKLTHRIIVNSHGVLLVFLNPILSRNG